ncbi:MAG TPA: sigma 54-interacting transcriptional regulator [Polyangiaceae bacterium]|nr:sigma 54-interacting transcriptional regulator [Polyangiaceae bacterium]
MVVMDETRRPVRVPDPSSLPTAPSKPESIRRADEPLTLHLAGPDAAFRRHLLSGPVVRIGRGDDNDIVLEGEQVSRHHAEIREEADGWTVLDLLSLNHVYVNGREVTKASLEPGTIVRFGEWVCVVGRGKACVGQIEGDLFGSAALESAVADLRLAARQPLNVVISGETGTGKELVARALFRWSQLKGKFVAVNCAALADGLVEAELFGHERGAFTHATSARPGLVRSADKGLLFLDEIAELTLSAQAKLLRVLEEAEVLPVGASEPVPLELRVAAATNRDLDAMVAEGTFRADLLARLAGIVVRMPPLRMRREDILPLFHRFVHKILDRNAPLSPELAEALTLYAWPGNVRELRQVASRTAAIRPNERPWRPRDVQLGNERQRSERSAPERVDPNSTPRRRPLERGEVEAALRASNGIVAQAAKRLGVVKQTLYTFIEGNGISLSDFRATSREH